MENQFERSEILLGAKSTEILKEKKIAVFGVGGVGGFAIEALARSGIGEFLLVDSDLVSLSNLNRQIIALHSTVGKYKTEVMKERVLDINPSAKVITREVFYLPENGEQFDLKYYDYVIDCIDTVSAKIDLAKRCFDLNVPEISAMGAGNKYDPMQFTVTDVYDTSVCPLAKVMRRELKKANVSKLKVLYSIEEPLKRQGTTDENGKRVRPTTGSLPFVPSIAGLLIAKTVVYDLLKLNK